MPETMPWGQLVLACWPLWLAYAVLVVVGTANWWARR
jgi:hypothetical protein